MKTKKNVLIEKQNLKIGDVWRVEISFSSINDTKPTAFVKAKRLFLLESFGKSPDCFSCQSFQ